MNEPVASTPPSADLEVGLPAPEKTSTPESVTERTRAPAPADPGVDIDLDAIERDLTDVQRALDRLNDGTYWTDEITGEPIGDDVLTAFPLTRTVSG